MKTIPVRLAHSPYEIRVANDFSGLGASIQSRKAVKRALIVTHGRLQKWFGEPVRKSLSRAGVEAGFFLIPEGERAKSLKTVQSIYRAALRAKLDRGSLVIALGGGVAGDIAGFAAATFLRGIPLVQVPTTLLAMVDSSIGGKVGVDLKDAKNYIGSFHQPGLVWINVRTLETLPEREFRNGMAEVIKYGVIADPKLFRALESEVPFPKAVPSLSLINVISACAGIKAGVVSKDEKETKGLREILNFGHTWGHAIETFTGYRIYKHGEAIAIGMCAAGWMAAKDGLWKNEDLTRLEDLLNRAGLPTCLKNRLDSKKLLQILYRDKKNRNGALRFVLPTRIGKVIVKEVSEKSALSGLDAVQP